MSKSQGKPGKVRKFQVKSLLVKKKSGNFFQQTAKQIYELMHMILFFISVFLFLSVINSCEQVNGKVSLILFLFIYLFIYFTDSYFKPHFGMISLIVKIAQNKLYGNIENCKLGIVEIRKLGINVGNCLKDAKRQSCHHIETSQLICTA